MHHLRMIAACLLFAIAGCADTRPLPPAVWTGQLSATRPTPASQAVAVPDLSTSRSFAVGFARVPPERVIVVARMLMEPAHGPLKHVRRDLPNGRIHHLLLTPRIDRKSTRLN